MISSPIETRAKCHIPIPPVFPEYSQNVYTPTEHRVPHQHVNYIRVMSWNNENVDIINTISNHYFSFNLKVLETFLFRESLRNKYGQFNLEMIIREIRRE